MACGHREVLIRGYVDEVMISCGAEVIAQHRRCTWRSLIRNPTAAAHGLGKLLKYVGRSNVLWGTDSIWYDPASRRSPQAGRTPVGKPGDLPSGLERARQGSALPP